MGLRGAAVTRRVGLVGGAESAVKGSTDVLRDGIAPGEVGRLRRGRLPVVRATGGRPGPLIGGKLLIAGSGLVVLNGGDVGESGGRADPLPAPVTSELLTSSSEDVYGEAFFGRSFPLLGPLPFPARKMGGAPRDGRSVVGLRGRLIGGRLRGISAPGRGTPPVAPGCSPRARRAWVDKVPPPFRGGRVVRLSTRDGVSPSCLVRGGSPCVCVCVCVCVRVHICVCVHMCVCVWGGGGCMYK